MYTLWQEPSEHGQYKRWADILSKDIDPYLYEFTIQIANAQTPIKGMPELVKTLHDKGYTLMIASDIGDEVYELLKQRYPFFNYFSHVQGVDYSEPDPILKKDPAFFANFDEKHNKQKKKLILIDDSENKIESAQQTPAFKNAIQFAGFKPLVNRLYEMGVLTNEEKEDLLQHD